MTTRCWCGQAALQPFSDDYARCAKCETLVCTSVAAPNDPRVRDEASDFYGWDYFHHDQVRRGVPPIETRARTDLFDRCVYWLNALSGFKLPPARVLELGSAHGGFVALLRHAGYEALGLDLSPSIVELARRTFEVPMLVGPVEDQSALEPGSLDVIVMMDVIEHLSDPMATLAHGMRLLKPDGILLIQTPCYPAGRSFQELSQAKDRVLVHLCPGEHPHVFSRESLSKLLGRVGAPHVEFLQPIFWFYDMFCVAGRQPIQKLTSEARDAAFSRNANARFAQALLDGEDRYRGLLAKHRQLIDENRSLRAQLAAGRATLEPAQAD